MRITALSGLSATRLKHSPRDIRDVWRRQTRSRITLRVSGLFAADAGAGEEITEASSLLALRLNEKFLALEVAGVFQ